ncbi:MAG TPA: hypothetical protein DCE41_34785 [Cytophagales bacterium]|nr:hypothetical protein [Cytophagales bacterium]
MKGNYLAFFFVLLSSGAWCQQATPVEPEKSRHEQWMEDIEFFETEFVDQAPTLDAESRTAGKAILADLRDNLDGLSDIQIHLEIARCVVLADEGHTDLTFPKMDKIPLRFYHFADGYYVIKTDSANVDYLGGKLLSVNAVPISELEERLFPYIAGIESWKKYQMLLLLPAPELYYELGMGEKEYMTLELEKDGQAVTVDLSPKSKKEGMRWYEAWANLGNDSEGEYGWMYLKDPAMTPPLYLNRSKEGVFYEFLDAEKIAYFNINSYWDSCPDFEGVLDEYFEILKTKPGYDVVVDLRNYTGGNYGYATKLATVPPRLIDKEQKIYLVTSSLTFSAGIVTAARVKYYAKDRIVVVGEEVGDRLYFWAESETHILPNSGIRVYDPQKEHDWVDDKWRLGKTHFANYKYGVPAKELDVDQKIGLSFDDYLHQRDPIMDWILGNK